MQPNASVMKRIRDDSHKIVFNNSLASSLTCLAEIKINYTAKYVKMN